MKRVLCILMLFTALIGLNASAEECEHMYVSYVYYGGAYYSVSDVAHVH